jgi:hypothetical protein
VLFFFVVDIIFVVEGHSFPRKNGFWSLIIENESFRCLVATDAMTIQSCKYTCPTSLVTIQGLFHIFFHLDDREWRQKTFKSSCTRAVSNALSGLQGLHF